MMRCFRFIWLAAGVLSTLVGSSQNFGGNPSSIKWRQFNTPYARVIFPTGLDSSAARVATITGALLQQDAANIGKEHRKISVVLQANNTISNAYVQLAPYRSEFYLTPPQNPFELGSQRWADNLAVHEWRHVEQNSNFNHGLSKFFSVLLGEQGQAFANALAVPDWFYEGDAVWNETAFSSLGRGRLPYNFIAYKSLQIAGDNFSYTKLRNGSYKDLVPSHYDLGYLAVTYGREKYGPDIWKKITADAVRFKGLFYPWQKAVKRHTGISFTQFQYDALNYFRQQWKNEKQPAVEWLTGNEKRNVVNYSYPYPETDSSIIALKTSYRQIPVFVRRNNDGSETKIAIKDIGYEDYFSYKNGNIVYTALQPDARWGNRDYSVIRLLHIADGTTVSIGKKGKFYSPDINESGNLVSVVKADPALPAQLLLINVSGETLQSLTAQNGDFYSHPKFINDTTIVVAVRLTNGKMGWLLWHTGSNSTSWLQQPAAQIIGFLVVWHDSLYYSGTHQTSDALFALSLKDKTTPVLLATYPTGIYQGFENKGKVIGSVFTADGNRLGSFNTINESVTDNTLQPLYAQSTFTDKLNIAVLPSGQFQSEKFSKAYRLFNFHSWQPEVISEREYGVSFLGENVLSTLYSQLSYIYNSNENSHKLSAGFTYGGWYVQPFTNIDQTFHRQIVLNADTTLLYNEREANIGLILPLNLSFGKAYRFLHFSASFSNANVSWQGIAKNIFKNNNVNYITGRANYTVQIQRAVQQIYPRFAESYAITYQRAVNNVAAWQFLANGSLYLPGFFNTHNIVLTAAYQERDTLRQYVFSNSFPFSRGYESVNFPRMLRIGVNYHLPLFYPDWGFGNILYFRRIRMNAFYDYTRGKSLRTGLTYPFSTAGSEFFFDTKWWNQLPLTIGVRYSRLLNNPVGNVGNPNQWEIVLPVNLLQR
jgi:hypothetical protein